LSPDGKKFVFAGYDETNGPGNVPLPDRQGFRRALLNPNTIEVFDILRKERVKLSGLSNSNRYPSVSWDPFSSKIIYFSLSRNKDQNGFYIYDPVSLSIQQIKRGSVALQDSVLSTLENNNILVGVKNTSISTAGNLGGKYRDSLVTGNLGTSSGENINRLQLKTISFKTELGPKRIRQQSTLTCKDLATQQCNSWLGTNFTPDQEGGPPDSAYNSCWETQKELAETAETCMDSPLYLYGKPGTYIKIKIGTQIYGSNAPQEGGYYEGFLTGDGGLKIESRSFSNISFDYTPSLRRLPKLNYGKTVKSEEVAKTLEEYGEKLGLNLAEIKDLTVSIDQFHSPYVFVSFFDDETSKVILPISFDPVPDVYRNIVFYLRPLDNPIASNPPRFEKIPQRKGFTAIEVSSIIDQ